MKRYAVFEGKVLSGNKSTAFPNRQLYLDVESKIRDQGRYHLHTFWFGWTRYLLDTGRKKDSVDRWDCWFCLDELTAFIERCTAERNTLMIYGHNLYYDLQVIGFFRRFAALGWKLDFIYDKGLTFILVIRKGGRSIKCISTTNYFDYSLSVLGDHLGMKKLEVDPLKARLDETIPYCRQDVAILSEAVKQYRAFNRDHDTGRFSMTRASQSFSAYRHRFMDYPITIHADKRVVDLERAAYYGGRTEAFRWGAQKGGPFVFLDVNSMYPFVMHRYRYPSKLVEYIEDAELSYVRRWLPSSAMIADVTLETSEPMFAYRGKDKLLFPVGRFRTCVCSEGLRRALDSCIVEKVHRLAVYECRYLFRAYVEYFYPLKAQYKFEGNKIYTAIVKMFLNSLYGKFGQKRPKQEIIDNPAMISPSRIEEVDVRSGLSWIRTGLFGKEIIEWGETNGHNSFVAIAAEVTEYARFALWDLFDRVDRDRVLYCDTDSIVIPESDLEGRDLPISDHVLGACSVDRRTERLVLYNPKDYVTDAGRKTKGVPKTATQVADHTWEYEQFRRIATHQREQIAEGFISCPTVKTVDVSYDKGIVLPDGSIVPYLFDCS